MLKFYCNGKHHQHFYSSLITQSAKEAIEKGVSLWLPQMKEVVKPDGAAVDPVEVRTRLEIFY